MDAPSNCMYSNSNPLLLMKISVQVREFHLYQTSESMRVATWHLKRERWLMY